MAIANFKPVTSLTAYQLQEWQNDLSAANLQIEEDKLLIEQYKNEKETTFDIGLEIKNELQKAIDEIEKTRDEMWNELNAFAGILWDEFSTHASTTPEDIFNQIFEPFLQALEPLMNVVGSIGLPEIPIIGNIQAIVQKIAKTGQLIAKLPKSVRDAARQEMEEMKQLQKNKEKAEREKRQLGMSRWDRFKDDFRNSKLGKIILEIVEIFKEILQILQMICQCAVMAALLVILEKIKPIVGMLGDAVALVSNAYTVLKMLMFSQAQMLRFFYKMIEEKLSELNGLLNFLICGGWSLPTNFLISAAYSDMVCCQVDAKEAQLNIDRISLSSQIDNGNTLISTLKEELDRVDANITEYENDGGAFDGAECEDQYLIDMRNDKATLEDKIDIETKTNNVRQAEMLSVVDFLKAWNNGEATNFYNTNFNDLINQDAALSTTVKENAEKKAKLSAELNEANAALEKAKADLSAAKEAEQKKKEK